MRDGFRLWSLCVEKHNNKKTQQHKNSSTPPQSFALRGNGEKKLNKNIIPAPPSMDAEGENGALSPAPPSRHTPVFSPRILGGVYHPRHWFHYPRAHRGPSAEGRGNETSCQGRRTKREHVEERIRPGEEVWELWGGWWWWWGG